MFLAEYNIATGDASVMPGLRRLALEAARGQSAVGSWGHGFARPDGRLGGYGMMNSPGVPLTISLVMARAAGVDDPQVALAIQRRARLLRCYIGKGCIPYGDHAPWMSPTPAQDRVLNRGYFTNEFLTETSVRRATALYYASLSELDAQIGRMVRVLKAKGLYDSTLILFTSDHGEYLGFHHLLLKGNHLYDPLPKVPLIIQYLRGLATGSVRDELVNTIDVAPTILKAAGLNIPPGMRGLNLADPAVAREVVFCETRAHVMARTLTSKLILDTAKSARSMFFDLDQDRLEMTNRFNDRGREDEIARLTRAIETWRPAKLPGVYLDENAPQVQRPNVPQDRAHRDEIADWYARQMQQWRATNGGR